VVYEKLKEEFQAPQENEADQVVRIDTMDEAEITAEELLGCLVQ